MCVCVYVCEFARARACVVKARERERTCKCVYGRVQLDLNHVLYPDAIPEPNANANPDPDPDVDPNANPDPNADPNPNSDPNPDVDPNPKADPNRDSDPDVDSHSNPPRDRISALSLFCCSHFRHANDRSISLECVFMFFREIKIIGNSLYIFAGNRRTNFHLFNRFDQNSFFFRRFRGRILRGRMCVCVYVCMYVCIYG